MNGFVVTKAQQYHGDLFMVIYDGHGRQVNYIEVAGQDKNIKLDVSGMSPGLHNAVLYLDGKVISSGKFIVEN